MVAAWGAVFYVLIGYPLIVVGLGRLVGPRSSPAEKEGGELPDVTILVAAYNEASVIEERISNILDLDYPADRLEVLVVADGSDDATVDLVRDFPDDRVAVTFEPARQGKSAALTRAVPLVRSSILVFSDANNTYEPDALLRLVSHFADPEVGAVTGAKRVTPADGAVAAGEGLYWRYESAIKESESRIGSCVAVTGEILAIRADLWQPIPTGVINDDFYIALSVMSADFDVVYEPGAVSWEPPSESVADDRVRRERIVAGRVQAIGMAPRLLPWHRPLVVWQVISHKLLRPFIPALAGLGLLGTGMAVRDSIRSGRGRLLPVVALIGQTALFVTAAVGRRSSDAGRIPRLAAYLVDSHRSSVVGSIGYLRGQRTAVWDKVDRTGPPNPSPSS